MSHEKNDKNQITDYRIHFFDQLSERWDTKEQNPQETIDRLQDEMDRLNFRQNQTILEVGCGTGQVTGWLSTLVHPSRVTAIDFSEKMIARAQSKNIPADFRRLDVCRDKLPAKTYDVVFCFHSFPHFRDQTFALQNFARALKPGGELIVMHLAGSKQINDFHDHVGGHVAGDHLPCQHTWEKLLAQSNFEQTDYIDRDDLFFLQAVSPK